MSDTIEVELLDNVYLRIGCEIDQAFELKEFFSCYVPNYKYNPKYKARMWDGKISFFNIHDHTLPIGLLKYLKPFLVKFNYKIKFLFDRRILENDIEKDDLEPFYDALFGNLDINPRDYQRDAIFAAIKHKRGVLEAATGCHAKGTNVIMYDGSAKRVEDVLVGDVLMGPDNTPRIVQRLYSGVESMFKITPKRGKSFIINENHILHLKFTGGSKSKNRCGGNEYIDISVKDYLNETKTFKHETKLLYNDRIIDFNTQNDDIGLLDPYFIGLYLGDGHTYHTQITTMDDEIVSHSKTVASRYNLQLKEECGSGLAKTYTFHGCKGKRNPIGEDFEKLGLYFINNDKRTSCDNKFIPDVIKYGSYEYRTQCIAGLIDSDGSLGKKSFDFCVSSNRLATDMAFMCRSLGLYVYESTKYINGVEYYRCSISGDTSIIPTRLLRKQSTGCRTDRGCNVRGFSIECVGDDSFYGFELDNDHLYFTDDFCVHHNSGKSIIIYSLIRFMMEDVEGKVLLVVPSINLVNQMFSDFQEYGWYDSYDDVTLLYGKSKNYDPKKKVLISTWQSIYKKSPGFFNQFGGVLVDETHGAKSASIQTVLRKCSKAEYKIGLTGTLPTDKVDRYNIYGFLGPVIYNLKSRTLIDRGFLTDIRIVNMHLKYNDAEIKLNKNRTYAEEIDFIVNNPKRNKALKFIINGKHVNPKQNVLILAQRINHIDNMVEYLKEACPDREVLKIDGKTDPDERERVRHYVESNDGIILVATYGTLSTGVNIPKLHHVIFASFYKSKIKVLQSIGRGLRKHKTKDVIIVWDLVDDMRWKKRKNKNTTDEYGFNYAYQHFLERLDHYKDQKFKFINKKITIDDL